MMKQLLALLLVFSFAGIASAQESGIYIKLGEARTKKAC